MRLRIALLLLITTAKVVSSEWTRVTFPLKLLQPDLQVISQYYTNIELVRAYVDWPDFITFCIDQVKMPSNEEYIKVYGPFELKSMGFLKTTYEALYYQNDKFYAKQKRGAMKKVLQDTAVTYLPRKIVRSRFSYLSIKYFSVETLERVIEPFYFKHKHYVDDFFCSKPTTLLAIMPNTYGHFLEYTFLSEDTPTTLADGKLRVILGKGNKNALILTDTIEAYRLVFEPKQLRVTIPETFDIQSKPLENVFGVRMAATGFISKVQRENHQKSVRMLSSDDLYHRRSAEIQRSMFVRDLLEKVTTVEPRYSHLSMLSKSVEPWPKSSLFQVHGQVLVKKVNFKDFVIDQSCPFTIEYANKERKFLFGGRTVDKIYTDESKMWVDGEGPVPAPATKVSFMY